jgi:hypothetical protein
VWTRAHYRGSLFQGLIHSLYWYKKILKKESKVGHNYFSRFLMLPVKMIELCTMYENIMLNNYMIISYGSDTLNKHEISE